MEHEFQHIGQQLGAQSLARGAALLVWVLDAERPLAVADLVAASGLPKSSVSRTVSALVRFGLLERVGARGPVRPGPVMHRYASRGGSQRSLAELAREPLEQLAAVSQETVNLAVPRPMGVETIAQIDGPHILGASQWVGRTVGYHCTAAGKVFLAFGTAPIPRTLEVSTPETITDRADLERQLEAIALAGWAETRDELELGLTAIAAPVRDLGGETVAALTISGPSVRLSHARCVDMSPALIKESSRLAETLGFRVTQGDEAA